MTVGTKIFLALFALIVGTLVVYYGAVMPDGPAKAPTEASAEESDRLAAPAQPSDVQIGEQEIAVPPSAPRSSPPPRDPLPIAPASFVPQPENASTAGGLISEGVREADGTMTAFGSGGGAAPSGDISNLKVTPGAAINTSAPPSFLPLVGLNNGDLRSDGDAVSKGDVQQPIDHGAENPPATSTSGDDPATPVEQPAIAEPSVAQPATPQPIVTSNHTEYTIAGNDTFTSIAESWFGDPNKWSLIAKENPTVDPQRLKIGQKILLPPKSAANAPAIPDPVLADGETIHVVQSGDTLIRIARATYGADARWEDIYELNKMLIGANPANLKVGMKLRMPKK